MPHTAAAATLWRPTVQVPFQGSCRLGTHHRENICPWRWLLADYFDIFVENVTRGLWKPVWDWCFLTWTKWLGMKIKSDQKRHDSIFKFSVAEFSGRFCFAFLSTWRTTTVASRAFAEPFRGWGLTFSKMLFHPNHHWKSFILDSFNDIITTILARFHPNF